MFSRAKRATDRAVVMPFEWLDAAHAPAPPPPRPQAPETTPPTVDDQERLAALERDAFAKGFAQGERAGAEAAAKRGDAMLRRLTQTLQEVTELRSEMIRQTEQQLVRLALAIARRLVHREISLDPDLLIAIARVAMDRLGDMASVTVRLNPEDFAATAATREREWSGAQVSVVADARIQRGGCRIESDFGAVDAGVDAQLQELAQALLNDAPAHVPHR
jgi:flagellar assembly protein FliH